MMMSLRMKAKAESWLRQTSTTLFYHPIVHSNYISRFLHALVPVWYGLLPVVALSLWVCLQNRTRVESVLCVSVVSLYTVLISVAVTHYSSRVVFQRLPLHSLPFRLKFVRRLLPGSAKRETSPSAVRSALSVKTPSTSLLTHLRRHVQIVGSTTLTTLVSHEVYLIHQMSDNTFSH